MRPVEDLNRQQQVDDLYHAYPRKVSPGYAKKCIDRALTGLSLTREDGFGYLLGRVQIYAASPAGTQATRQFIPHPSTWFNGHKWEEDDSEWQLVGGKVNPLDPVSPPKRTPDEVRAAQDAWFKGRADRESERQRLETSWRILEASLRDLPCTVLDMAWDVAFYDTVPLLRHKWVRSKLFEDRIQMSAVASVLRRSGYKV